MTSHSSTTVRVAKLVLAIALMLAGGAAFAQQPTLVKDLAYFDWNLGLGYILPTDGGIFFSTEREAGLYRSDGTTAGTEIVDPPRRMDTYGTKALLGSRFVYSNNGAFDLWITDGTGVGTRVVKTIRSDGPSEINTMVSALGKVFFGANDGVHGAELWVTDGTEAGTFMLADLNPTGDANPRQMVEFNSRLYFAAFDSMGQYRLYSTSGAAGDVTLVSPAIVGALNVAPELEVYAGNLYFTGNDYRGVELWKTDGTAQGTSIVADIKPGSGSSNIWSMYGGADALYFTANDGSNGYELYRSDGTAAGTTLLKDINPGPGDSLPYNFVKLNGWVLFRARTATEGLELWRTDGTPSGTLMVKDSVPGTGNGDFGNAIVAGGVVYYAGGQSGTGAELMRTDGTPEGTTLVADMATGTASGSPFGFAIVGSKLLFFARSGTAQDEKLWSLSLCAAPAAVTNLSAIDAPGGATLSWSTVSGASSYAVYRSDAVELPGGLFIRLGETTSTSYVDPAPAGHTYIYKVTAINAQGCESEFSQPVDVVVGCFLADTTVSSVEPSVSCPSDTSGPMYLLADGGGSAHREWGYRTSPGGPFNSLYYGSLVFSLNPQRLPGEGDYYIVCQIQLPCGTTVYSDETLLHVTSTVDVQIIDVPAEVCPGFQSHGYAIPRLMSYDPTMTYNWSITNGTITSDPSQTWVNFVIDGTAPAQLSATITRGSCSGSASTTIGIKTIAPPVIDSYVTEVCPSSQSNAIVAYDPSYTGFSWSIENGTLTSSPTEGWVQYTAGTTGPVRLTVTVTTNEGCTATSTREIPLKTIPPPVIETVTGMCALSSSTAWVAFDPSHASFAWSIENGTLNSPANYSYASYTAGTTGPVRLTVTVTTTDGCTATNTVEIPLSSIPPPVIETQESATCAGLSLFAWVSYPDVVAYQWTVENGTITTPTATGPGLICESGASGVMRVSLSVTTTGGCVATTTRDFPIQQWSCPIVMPNGPTTFCEGGSVVLTATAGAAYNWSNGATTRSITVTQSGSYYPTVTFENGCGAAAIEPTQVTVNPLPVATITPNGPTTFCEGGSVVLTASAGSNYLWSNGATTQAITATQASNFSVTVTNASGCSTTSAATAVTVTSLPAATITPNGATTFCQGGSVVLTASAGTGYLWSNGATTQAITATQAGNYSVTVTNASGCSTTSAATAVTVNTIPAATIAPNGATTFCQGGSVVLTASAGTSYLWSNGATTPAITVTQSGNYSVTVTNASGCSTTSAATAVTVKALPTAIVSGGGNICAGGSTTVQASLTGTAPWSITWSDGVVQNGIATSVATRSVNPPTTRSYSITSVSDASCSGSSSGSAVVTVIPLPTAVVSGSATICNGSQATVSAVLTGVGPWALTWSDGFVQSGIAASPATRAVTPSVTTTYSVTAVSGASCGGAASGSATITVNQKPTINTQPASKTIKKNTTTTLTVAASGTGTLSYQWYRGASGVTSAPVGTNSTSFTTPKLLSTTQYWVKVTNACGSTNSVTATVTVP